MEKIYDENNNMIKQTFFDGSIFEYEYDDNNNVIKKTFPDGFEVVED